MFASVLIANRGEIACRIMRTARRMGVRTVAVYSEADARALHVRSADVAVPIGPSPAAESYLRGDKIIAAAKETGAEAIHPGYGFLSENVDFAQAVIDAGLIWIGPQPASIRAMGLKDEAKRRMQAAGVPVTPGYLGADQAPARLAAEAEAIGYPVLIKAVAGGGGRGMRKAEQASEFAGALDAAKREAKAAFGDDRVLLEKYVTRPRHIEVQVFGDEHGSVVHLFERDCSLQRRHQKVIEEAPAPGMDEETRAAVCGAAVRAAEAVNYVGAGTIEFIADASDGLRADRIWFMEMNTRLQVEHPVTEEITGVDLVEWQFRVAAGEKLPLKQKDLRINGHAIEARLYAEDPAKGFLPSTGRLQHFAHDFLALRFDAAVEAGDEISPYYDAMIAKLIAHAGTRNDAIHFLRVECETAVEVWPVKTNLGFLARCLREQRFVRGDVDTGLIAAIPSLPDRPDPSNAAATIAAGAFLTREHNAVTPWAAIQGFRVNAAARRDVRLISGDRRYEVEANSFAFSNVTVRGDKAIVFDLGEAFEFALDTGDADASTTAVSDGSIRAPMPGKIVAVAVKKGAALKTGDAILTLEAMKMEHVLRAPYGGALATLSAKLGDQVVEGQVLAAMEKSA